jgi:hypothetical protein
MDSSGQGRVVERFGTDGIETTTSRLDCLCGSVAIISICIASPAPGTFSLTRWCDLCQQSQTSSWHSSGPKCGGSL